MIGMSRLVSGRRTCLPMAQFHLGSSECTATAVSPSMVSGRVVATIMYTVAWASCPCPPVFSGPALFELAAPLDTGWKPVLLGYSVPALFELAAPLDTVLRG